MPCTPPKARWLMKNGQGIGKRNKLGIFYIQLKHKIEPDPHQTLALGIDPGSHFEGYSVVGTQDTVLNIMAEAPTHVKANIKTRRQMRQARRHRNKWRRPARFQNRLRHRQCLPPSTRSRWEAKLRIVQQLLKILPISMVVIEDVSAATRKGPGRKWNQAFSPIQHGKEHLYSQLRNLRLDVYTYEGWQTKALREEYGLIKTKQKDKQSFESHAVDAWVMAAAEIGAKAPTCKRLYYLREVTFSRRQLHRLQFSPGGKRKPYGSTRSLGWKRGTLVKHPKYGLTAIGGCDLKTSRISLHAYRTNKRLCQNAKVSDITGLTWTPYRTTYLKKKGEALSSTVVKTA